MPVRALYNEIVKAMGHDTAPGLVLIAAAAAALLVMNSGLADGYTAALATKFTIAYGDIGLSKPLLLWINDFLMAIFFLLVGLEIKREIIAGNLSSFRAASLPAIAAVGGMIVPALIYWGFNAGDSDAMRGWAIPAATDIAFALGVLALLGRRVPIALKVFLLAVAIIDDLGAIVIIALFYTADLSGAALGISALMIIALTALNRLGVRAITPYMLLGVVLWVAVLKSGVHATLAGVVVAFCIPMGEREDEDEPPLYRLEHALVPWVSFGIMPIFAFANAGVSLAGMGPSSLLEPISAGIAVGLFAGKQIGIVLACVLAVMLGISKLPSGINWQQIWGVSLLAGIGFTMSLFIGNLAFETPEQAASVRVGVLSGSIVSAVLGYIVLRLSHRAAERRVGAEAINR
ncbi:MAG: Na+/H+ antiporter NhaA [Alphaproteobacteria bacterium]|nr:Na+/H+ antiporter NhaA [Alphaproteobacteria bacterium]